MKVGKLYIAHKVQTYAGIPFQKVEVIAVNFDKNYVLFRPEYPLEELGCTIDYFEREFAKWN